MTLKNFWVGHHQSMVTHHEWFIKFYEEGVQIIQQGNEDKFLFNQDNTGKITPRKLTPAQREAEIKTFEEKLEKEKEALIKARADLKNAQNKLFGKNDVQPVKKTPNTPVQPAPKSDKEQFDTLGRNYARTPEQNKLYMTLCKKLAEEGDLSAQEILARAYEKGSGVPKNAVEAFRWFECAALQGLIPAMSKLVEYYCKGLGREKPDFVKAGQLAHELLKDKDHISGRVYDEVIELVKKYFKDDKSFRGYIDEWNKSYGIEPESMSTESDEDISIEDLHPIDNPVVTDVVEGNRIQGGIENPLERNYCFMSAVLQAITVLPEVRKCFTANPNDPVSHLGNEILQKIESGKNVADAEMLAFRKACLADHLVRTENGMGCAADFIMQILERYQIANTFSFERKIELGERLKEKAVGNVPRDRALAMELCTKQEKIDRVNKEKSSIFIDEDDVKKAAGNLTMQALIDGHLTNEEDVVVREESKGQLYRVSYRAKKISTIRDKKKYPDVTVVRVGQPNGNHKVIHDADTVKIGKAQYQLVSVITHPTLHFVALIKKGNQVLKMDDDLLSKENSLNQQPGVLYFYKKIAEEVVEDLKETPVENVNQEKVETVEKPPATDETLQQLRDEIAKLRRDTEALQRDKKSLEKQVKHLQGTPLPSIRPASPVRSAPSSSDQESPEDIVFGAIAEIRSYFLGVWDEDEPFDSESLGEIDEINFSLGKYVDQITENIFVEGVENLLLTRRARIVSTFENIQAITSPGNLEASIEHVVNRTSWKMEEVKTFLTFLKDASNLVLGLIPAEITPPPPPPPPGTSKPEIAPSLPKIPSSSALRPVSSKPITLGADEMKFESFLNMILEGIELQYGDQLGNLEQEYEQCRIAFRNAKNHNENVARGRKKEQLIPDREVTLLGNKFSEVGARKKEAEAKRIAATQNLAGWLTTLSEIVPNIVVSNPSVNDTVISDALNSLRSGKSLGFNIPENFTFKTAPKLNFNSNMLDRCKQNAPSSDSSESEMSGYSE